MYAVQCPECGEQTSEAQTLLRDAEGDAYMHNQYAGHTAFVVGDRRNR